MPITVETFSSDIQKINESFKKGSGFQEALLEYKNHLTHLVEPENGATDLDKFNYFYSIFQPGILALQTDYFSMVSTASKYIPQIYKQKNGISVQQAETFFVALDKCTVRVKRELEGSVSKTTLLLGYVFTALIAFCVQLEQLFNTRDDGCDIYFSIGKLIRSAQLCLDLLEAVPDNIYTQFFLDQDQGRFYFADCTMDAMKQANTLTRYLKGLYSGGLLKGEIQILSSPNEIEEFTNLLSSLCVLTSLLAPKTPKNSKTEEESIDSQIKDNVGNASFHGVSDLQQESIEKLIKYFEQVQIPSPANRESPSIYSLCQKTILPMKFTAITFTRTQDGCEGGQVALLKVPKKTEQAQNKINLKNLGITVLVLMALGAVCGGIYYAVSSNGQNDEADDYESFHRSNNNLFCYIFQTCQDTVQSFLDKNILTEECMALGNNCSPENYLVNKSEAFCELTPEEVVQLQYLCEVPGINSNETLTTVYDSNETLTTVYDIVGPATTSRHDATTATTSRHDATTATTSKHDATTATNSSGHGATTEPVPEDTSKPVVENKTKKNQKQSLIQLRRSYIRKGSYNPCSFHSFFCSSDKRLRQFPKACKLIKDDCEESKAQQVNGCIICK